MKWQNVPVTIESTGRVVTINLDAKKTDNHFMGMPIYGFITGLVGRLNGSFVSLLPPSTGAAAPPMPVAPTGPTIPPTNNATTPSANGTPPAGHNIPVSITPGASSKTDDAYNPNPVKVKVGDTVTWTNNDSTPHTVTSGSNATPDGKFDSSPGLKTLILLGKPLVTSLLKQESIRTTASFIQTWWEQLA